MKKVILSVGLFAMTLSAKAQDLTFDAGLKGAYSATEMFNNNISNLGASQDYKMATGSNYGVALNANYGKIGLTVEFLSGTFNTGYQGTFGSTAYTSNVALKTFSVPILVKFGGQTGGYAELGISTNSVKSATYSVDQPVSNPLGGNNVGSSYKGFTTAVLGFGTKISLSDNLPLILNLGMRLQYGITDAAGVDALNYNLTSKAIYPTYEKSSAASIGLHVGVTYKIK